jgi:3-methylcrotonyl-CoA carboxylase alpha subunit
MVMVEYQANGFAMSTDGPRHAVAGHLDTYGSLHMVIDGEHLTATVVEDRGASYIFLAGRRYVLRFLDPLDVSSEAHHSESSLLAPMPGRVIAQLVEPGHVVGKGAPLMILEAMKMECTIYAPSDGRVTSFHFEAGAQVNEGVELLQFERDADKAADKN